MWHIIALCIVLGTVKAAFAQKKLSTSLDLQALKSLTLPTAAGDSINFGNVLEAQPFTLLVLYRGVW